MARYGSKAIHGIPEAMEQVPVNQSRIPARMAFLKPISAAIAIGTGGPFGAEGPIIATGGAAGSLVGQIVRTTADERKTLLAAEAAAGMAATFGSPVSAVLLGVELLLSNIARAISSPSHSPRSLVPAFVSHNVVGLLLSLSDHDDDMLGELESFDTSFVDERNGAVFERDATLAIGV